MSRATTLVASTRKQCALPLLCTTSSAVVSAGNRNDTHNVRINIYIHTDTTSLDNYSIDGATISINWCKRESAVSQSQQSLRVSSLLQSAVSYSQQSLTVSSLLQPAVSYSQQSLTVSSLLLSAVSYSQQSLTVSSLLQSAVSYSQQSLTVSSLLQSAVSYSQQSLRATASLHWILDTIH